MIIFWIVHSYCYLSVSNICVPVHVVVLTLHLKSASLDLSSLLIHQLPQLLSNILSEQTSFQRICHIVTNYCMALMCILKQLQRFETSSVVSFPYYNALIKAEFNLLVVCTSGTLRHGLIRAKINLNASSRNIHLRIGDSERSQVRVIFGAKRY